MMQSQDLIQSVITYLTFWLLLSSDHGRCWTTGSVKLSCFFFMNIFTDGGNLHQVAPFEDFAESTMAYWKSTNYELQTPGDKRRS